ncbi:hypothetical protein QJ48_06595 [Paenibacillus sp. A3]|uniref:hypothetical protein n=1 Tax=Paenibacillus sp. A3 TaxID=1337054 RepID=UPI0006D5942D|nr:hypothetical protein [Paenibacillus sp. A3]KPV60270.1 hypothetical protein QJ48_06595 [Paenibacillus sp. A3]
MKNWIKPVDVSDVQLAFGGDMKKLLPPMSDIPREFQDGHTKWNDLIGKWFVLGLNKLNVTPRHIIAVPRGGKSSKVDYYCPR